MLQALAGPFPELLFCPTGGVRADAMGEYLAQPNVACVGGSWLTPRDAVAAGDWARITVLAEQACAAARVAPSNPR
jgi:2-dehydro-3-deoxyphosphogluconate aldolase/(4S)-4-hydroxy-2-oxoglutarate aldolase